VLVTSRVLARSASGRVQPAAGRPVAAGAVPATAAPCLDGHARVPGALLPLLLLPEQPAIKLAATTSAATTSAGRRPPPVTALLLTLTLPVSGLDEVSDHPATAPVRINVAEFRSHCATATGLR